jgi:hypothetical protein
MAIVIYGNGISDIKGRIGGIVHQKLGASLGIRRHVVPSIQSTNSLQSSNIHSVKVSTAWQALTPVQKNAWNNVSPSYPSYNRYGVAFTLNGYQLFYKINKRNALFGVPLITVPYTYSLINTYVVNVQNIDYNNHIFNITFPVFTPNSL